MAGVVVGKVQPLRDDPNQPRDQQPDPLAAVCRRNQRPAAVADLSAQIRMPFRKDQGNGAKKSGFRAIKQLARRHDVLEAVGDEKAKRVTGYEIAAAVGDDDAGAVGFVDR